MAAFQLLVAAGPEGLPAGEVARRTGALQNTSSSNLNVLASCGLITSRRAGRSIIYSVAHGQFGDLFEFLARDCCDGRPDLYAPLFARLLAACDAASSDDDREIGRTRQASGDCC